MVAEREWDGGWGDQCWMRCQELRIAGVGVPIETSIERERIIVRKRWSALGPLVRGPDPFVYQ